MSVFTISNCCDAPDSSIRIHLKVISGSTALSSQRREVGRHFGTFPFSEPVIGIAPGAAYGGAKRWLPERFAEAATEIARESLSAFALFGSAAERPVCELVEKSLAARGHRAINMAGRTSLAEFIELAAACHVFLTNDSGPMHIASALRSAHDSGFWGDRSPGDGSDGESQSSGSRACRMQSLPLAGVPDRSPLHDSRVRAASGHGGFLAPWTRTGSSVVSYYNSDGKVGYTKEDNFSCRS